MDGDPARLHRYFNAVDKTQAQFSRTRTRFGQAGDFVVIGEREDIDTIAGRTLY